MRRRYRWSEKEGRMVEVPWDSVQSVLAPTVWNDLPGYQSPASGLWIAGRKARREDLKRTGCRPYEGREQEAKEARKYWAEQERKTDQLAERMAHTAWAQAPERIRRIFRGK